MMYKAVAQTVLLQGSKSWLVMGVMLNVLEGFHRRVARRISGIIAKRVVDGKWKYPLVGASLEAVLLYLIQEYI